jgi:sugar (pentulose or hexulose) kinase
MWDVVADRPWPGAEELLGRSLLPGTVVVAGSPAGRAGDGVPAPLRGAVLTVAGHDHQAAAFAAGATLPGVLFDSLGTAEALLRHLPAPPDDDTVRLRIDRLAAQGVSVGRSVVPGHLCVLAGMLTGLTLERVCALVGASSRQARSALGSAALALPAGPDGDPDVTVRILASDGDGLTVSGVTEETTPAALFAAAVARLTRECGDLLRAIEEFAGPRSAAVAAGGWLNNPAVAAAKQRQHARFAASALGEAGATGAAVMAGIAAGVLQRPSPGDAPRWADGAPTSRLHAPLVTPATRTPSAAPPLPVTPRRTHG